MDNAYRKAEKKYIKRSIDVLKKEGYSCDIYIYKLQDIVSVLNEYYNKDNIEVLEEIDDYKFYFKYMLTAMADYAKEFLLGYYRAHTTQIILRERDTGIEVEHEFAYYPIIDITDIDHVDFDDVSYVYFDKSNGKIIKAPEDFDLTNITTIEELCDQYEDSETYDFSFIKNQIFLHKGDIGVRDLVLDCACSQIMNLRSLDLEIRLKRAKIFIKSMIDNIPNFEKADYLYGMVDNMYQELKQELVPTGYGLKKAKK